MHHHRRTWAQGFSYQEHDHRLLAGLPVADAVWITGNTTALRLHWFECSLTDDMDNDDDENRRKKVQ